MPAITIERIETYPIALPFVSGFTTSFGLQTHKVCVLVELVTTDGISGWGESSVELYPGYGSETVETALHILRNFVIPRLVGQTFDSPASVTQAMAHVRGHHHTKFGIEAAAWDAFAKAQGMPLVNYFETFLPEGHTSRGHAVVGVSIGIQPSYEDTVDVIKSRLEQGYGRIKLKIKPGWDVDFIRAVRKALPDTTIMVDANSAYTLDDATLLAELDEFDLLMIEQPLAHDDIYEHSKLQPQIKTPVCLDESVKTVGDLQVAIALGGIGILNLKPARVGGYAEAIKCYKVCVDHDLPMWIGGMLETGIGRAMNVAFASLPGVNLPCDISATERYFAEDISEPPFTLNPNSTIDVPEGIGIGVDVQRDRIEKARRAWDDLAAARV